MTSVAHVRTSNPAPDAQEAFCPFAREDVVLKSCLELQKSEPAPRTRRVSAARLAASSGLVVAEFQADSSRADSPVRISYGQAGSPVSTEQQNVNPLEIARYRGISA
jgi:hypothetical protein